MALEDCDSTATIKVIKRDVKMPFGDVLFSSRLGSNK
jgi:hypothetical protein